MKPLLVLVLLLCAACGDDTGGQMGHPATCSGLTRPPEEVAWMLDFGGMQRSYNVHVPPAYDPTRPSPVVLNFHGLSEPPDTQALFSGMSTKANTAGYLVVYPAGTGNPISWNAGTCCASAAQAHVDDVGFVRALLDALSSKLCIDSHRVFATGMSNGGMLTHRLACELSDRIAAFAPVAGDLVSSPCNPPRAVPILHFHGTADTYVPYTGSPSIGFPPVPDMMAAWAARDGCAATAQDSFSNGDTHCQSWPGCSAGAEVVLCTVEGGGHTWPGGLDVPTLGKTTTDINADDKMWEFFQKHVLP